MVSSGPRILVAHERLALGEATRRVLAAQGFVVEVVGDGEAAAAALSGGPWAALILDVALPGAIGCHELIQLAKAAKAPVKVILVASVFRRTSYKRRPTQLYGADDYVEIHHLGDQLPGKLWRLLGGDTSQLAGLVEAEAVLATLQEEGDRRLLEQREHASRLAALIVADMILYAGDRVLGAGSAEEARTQLAGDLEAARQLFRQIGGDPEGADPVGAAFDEVVSGLGLGAGEAPR